MITLATLLLTRKLGISVGNRFVLVVMDILAAQLLLVFVLRGIL